MLLSRWGGPPWWGGRPCPAILMQAAPRAPVPLGACGRGIVWAVLEPPPALPQPPPNPLKLVNRPFSTGNLSHIRKKCDEARCPKDSFCPGHLFMVIMILKNIWTHGLVAQAFQPVRLPSGTTATQKWQKCAPKPRLGGPSPLNIRIFSDAVAPFFSEPAQYSPRRGNIIA